MSFRCLGLFRLCSCSYPNLMQPFSGSQTTHGRKYRRAPQESEAISTAMISGHPLSPRQAKTLVEAVSTECRENFHFRLRNKKLHPASNFSDYALRAGSILIRFPRKRTSIALKKR